jgi:organic hydroperoxide reductase OsmC/OhrA
MKNHGDPRCGDQMGGEGERRGVPQRPLQPRTHNKLRRGMEVPASASPHVVGKWAVESAVDPEEMLVASLSSCHMLSFLHLARMAGFTVTAYEDHAEGTTAEIAPGRLAVTKVKLRPKIEWAGAAPEKAALDRLHHEAHEICFIANSVKTEVTVE